MSTSYTPIAAGGAGVNPLNSFSFKDVGINVELTPRVTTEGDVTVELTVESNAKLADQNVAGANYPSFATRKVTTRLRLRDGESNLLAGLLREDEANGVQGVPGAVNVPVFRQLFSGNKQVFRQTDLVMLLTPHIIRTSEITAADLQPIFIGSQQNFGLGGPAPLIAAPEPQVAPQTTPAPAPGITQSNTVPGGVIVAPPPGSSPVPGTVVVPPNQAAAPAPAPAAPAQQPQASVPEAAPAAAPPAPQAPGATSATTGEPIAPTVGSAQVIVTPPGTTFRVGGGPYTVPISVVNASRLSTVSLTLVFDPALLRVRSVQEGSFMRSGGAGATFTSEVGNGRVDITIARSADATGASGTGLLGAILFEAIGPGSATLTPSGAATGPGGTAMGLQFRPITVTVQR